MLQVLLVVLRQGRADFLYCGQQCVQLAQQEGVLPVQPGWARF